jgi:hypothetical protein
MVVSGFVTCRFPTLNLDPLENYRKIGMIDLFCELERERERGGYRRKRKYENYFDEF